MTDVAVYWYIFLMTIRNPSPPGGDERRDFIRIPYRTEAEVRAGALLVRSSGVIDLSMNGMRISSGDPVPPADTPCCVRILLGSEGPDRVSIEANGTVIRSGSGSVAIHFTGIGIESYWHLRRLILANADDPEQADREFVSHWGIRTARR